MAGLHRTHALGALIQLAVAFCLSRSVVVVANRGYHIAGRHSPPHAL